MKRAHRPDRFLVAAICASALLGGAHEAETQCLPFGPQSGNVIEQSFPPGGTARTSWRVTFGHHPKHGPFITGAWFKRHPADGWNTILYDARISEIFVPYDLNGPRFYESNYGTLIPVVAADLGPCGKKADGYVVKEIRDRGPIWKNYSAVRRGHELWLWGGWGAGNYNYIIRYEFRDDGSIGFRVGATAKNLPSMPWRTHSHTSLWRLDVDLMGAANDLVRVHRHNESIGSTWANVTVSPFAGNREGWENWDPLKATMLNVSDKRSTNALGRNVSYDLMLARAGTPRHAEAFVHHDFAVTNYRPGQLYYPSLPAYIQPAQSTDGRDVVIWHAVPGLHMPRTEDGIAAGGAVNGVALLMWSGFDLKPRDFFNSTPMYP